MKEKLTMTIAEYNASLTGTDKSICDLLFKEINTNLKGAESKVWHRHPVWFINGNPIVGYSKLKNCVQLLFWSGQTFDEPGLETEGSFKASQKRYASLDEVNLEDLHRWLQKSEKIQWDYKNIVKHRGVLEKIVV